MVSLIMWLRRHFENWTHSGPAYGFCALVRFWSIIWKPNHSVQYKNIIFYNFRCQVLITQFASNIGQSANKIWKKLWVYFSDSVEIWNSTLQNLETSEIRLFEWSGFSYGPNHLKIRPFKIQFLWILNCFVRWSVSPKELKTTQ